MTPETWALVGVVVGAVLGGGAQVLADSLRVRNDRQERTRDARRLAYGDVVAAFYDCIHEATIFRTQANRAGDQSMPPDVWQPYFEAVRRLSTAAAQVEILGGRDVAKAAHQMHTAVLNAGLIPEDGSANVEIDPDARERFIALAKRDLGLGERT